MICYRCLGILVAGFLGQVLLAASEPRPTERSLPIAAGPASEATEGINLPDQFGTLHTLGFPRTNAVVLTLADHKGSRQVESWVRPLKERYADRLTLAGVADVSKVPAFLRGRVRAGFREQMPYPVMLDWKGAVCRRFGYERGQVNVLLLDRSGTVRLRLTGEATPESFERLSVAIEELFRTAVSAATRPPPLEAAKPDPVPAGP